MGVTGADGNDAGPSPPGSIACTVKVYGVPFTRPLTTHDNEPPVLQVRPPGDAVTRYPEVARPPSKLDAAQLTDTALSPAVPMTEPGGSSGIPRRPTLSALTDPDLIEAQNRRKRGDSYAAIAGHFGVHPETVRRALKRL